MTRQAKYFRKDNNVWALTGEGTTENPYRQIVDANLQDQTTPAIILPFHRIHNSTTLTAASIIDERTFTVDDPTGAVVDSFMVVYNPDIGAFSTFYVTNVAGSVVTVDSLIDVAFPIGSYADFAVDDMAVDALGTNPVYGLRGSSNGDPLGVSFDLTRIIVICGTASAVDLAKFGDITRLTYGLMLRHRKLSGNVNVLNWKTNGELASTCYDWSPYSALNPAQGQHGFAARLTFAGQSKIGAVLRVNPGEDVEFIPQDQLGAITTYKIIAQGHVVD